MSNQRPKMPAMEYPKNPSRGKPNRCGPKLEAIMRDDPMIREEIIREKAIRFDDLSISEIKCSSPWCWKPILVFPCLSCLSASWNSRGISLRR